MALRPPGQRSTRLAGFALVAGATLYLATDLRSGWFPWDEGGIGQSAERVLRGELPHRDFQELYTGGLTFLHAVAFRVFGIDLVVPRVVLLAAFSAWVLCLYRVALRFLPFRLAILACILGVLWSLPNYPAAVPSWYNLFLATAALLALLKFESTRRRGWLVAAGFCIGLSVLVKIVGLFLLAAALFQVLFTEAATEHANEEAPMGAGALLLSGTAVAATLVFGVFLGTQGQPADMFRYLLPIAGLCAVIVMQTRHMPSVRAVAVLRRLGGLVAPFLIGASAPILLLLVYYTTRGAVPELLDGLFVRPAARLHFASQPAQSITGALMSIALFGFLASGAFLKPPASRLHRLTEFGVLGSLLVASVFSVKAYRFVVLALYHAAPIAIIVGCTSLISRSVRESDRTKLFGLLSVVTFASLVQFPYSTLLYFLYVAPLVILTLAAVARSTLGERLRPWTWTATLGFLAAFAVLSMNRQAPGLVGGWPSLGLRMTELAQPRASLRVPPEDSLLYEQLLSKIRATGDLALRYAGPDAPEVYFLAGVQNQTGILYEFFEDSETVRGTVESLPPDGGIAVINHEPPFSPPLSPATLQWLRNRYPASQRIGRFEVLWKP